VVEEVAVGAAVVAAVEPVRDRVGLGWRPALAAGILAHLDRIEVVEVIADDYFHAPRVARRALCTLAAQVPVVLHGVQMGLASTLPIATVRLDRMARLVEQVQPAFWSEHLAFVRGGGVEIGHLAAPPRHAGTVEGAARNLARARAVVGSAPLVENVATLLDPPGSTCEEAFWIADILTASGCALLLDLHNLYANASNFNFDPLEYLASLPMERIAAIHLAGGQWISGQRLLDDHLHDVPDPVYELLSEVGARVPQSLTVILERDGQYPSIAHLLAQLERAREALAAGRRRRTLIPQPGTGQTAQNRCDCQHTRHSSALEAFLAQLYTDARLRARFLAAPLAEATRAGLAAPEAQALQYMDCVGLELAARSFAHKRQQGQRAQARGRFSWGYG
jgi:hypothetical protein